jgi:hypothetical protein
VPARFDDRTDLGEKERDAGKLFSVPGELSRKNAKELVQDRLGKNELILLGDDAQQRLFPLTR